jgi:hypothetical protein
MYGCAKVFMVNYRTQPVSATGIHWAKENAV